MKNNESLESKTVNNPGRPRIRTKDFLSTICHVYGADPFLSYTVAANELGVGKMTISRSIHQLGLKSYVRRVRCLISDGAKLKRVERAEELDEYIETHPDTVFLFSDEKLWNVLASRNRQTQRCIARSPAEVPPLLTTKNPQSIMMLGN